MEQPLSFVAQGESSKICRLKKSLYGVNHTESLVGPFAYVVWAFGLSHSQKDHFVYWHQHQGKMLVLILHVDDIIITGMMRMGLQI